MGMFYQCRFQRATIRGIVANWSKVPQIKRPIRQMFTEPVTFILDQSYLSAD